ncbi:MAG: hypothetical protein ACKO5K_16955 [Armatimonadota bacterium]
MTTTHAATRVNPAHLPHDNGSRPAKRPLGAVRLAMITGWTPGDSFVWVGRLPIPVSKQAWREIGRRLMRRETD